MGDNFYKEYVESIIRSKGSMFVGMDYSDQEDLLEWIVGIDKEKEKTHSLEEQIKKTKEELLYDEIKILESKKQEIKAKLELIQNDLNNKEEALRKLQNRTKYSPKEGTPNWGAKKLEI